LYTKQQVSRLVDSVKCPQNPRNERHELIGEVFRSNNGTLASEIGQSTIANYQPMMWTETLVILKHYYSNISSKSGL